MSSLSTSTLGVSLSVFLLLVGRSTLAQQIEFCSSLNTGANYSIPVTNTFMSTGLYVEQCKQNYALAVVQGDTCWCSDYVPASTTNMGDCDEICPGFPLDFCGSTAKNLYGYIGVSKGLSGTKGAAENTTSTTNTTSIIGAINTTDSATTTITMCGVQSNRTVTVASDESSTLPTTFETLTWTPTPNINAKTDTPRRSY